MLLRQTLMYSAIFLLGVDVLLLLAARYYQCLTWLVLVVLELVGALSDLPCACPGWGSPPLWFG